MPIVDKRSPEEGARAKDLLSVLQRLWTYSITTKSDLAREYADQIAEAASRGWVTTLIVPGRAYHGRLWKLTPTGTLWLFAHAHEIADDEVENYVQSFAE